MKKSQTPNTSLNAMVPAIALIVVGVIFLLRNLDILDLGSRWWAFFLLVPLFFMGGRILDLRSGNSGTIPPEARGILTGFLSVALVMLIFLFHLDWSDVWPLFIILIGISFLFGRPGGGSERSGGPPGAETHGP